MLRKKIITMMGILTLLTAMTAGMTGCGSKASSDDSTDADAGTADSAAASAGDSSGEEATSLDGTYAWGDGNEFIMTFSTDGTVILYQNGYYRMEDADGETHLYLATLEDRSDETEYTLGGEAGGPYTLSPSDVTDEEAPIQLTYCGDEDQTDGFGSGVTDDFNGWYQYQSTSDDSNWNGMDIQWGFSEDGSYTIMIPENYEMQEDGKMKLQDTVYDYVLDGDELTLYYEGEVNSVWVKQ